MFAKKPELDFFADDRVYFYPRDKRNTVYGKSGERLVGFAKMIQIMGHQAQVQYG